MRIRALLLLFFVALTATAKDRTSYVFKRSSGNSHIMSSGSLESILRVAKKWEGPFIWMRRADGRAYLIRDAAAMAEAHAAFRELDALHPKHEEIAKRLRPLEKRAEEIEEQMDAISDSEEPDEAKLRELERKFRPLEQQARVVEREMEELEEKMDAIEKIAEKRLFDIVDRAIRRGVAQRVD